MNTSAEIDKIVPAFVAVLSGLANPTFDSINPFHKNRYASLAGVRNLVVPVLASKGLAVSQSLSTNEHGVVCKTRILHVSGQWLESDGFAVPVNKADSQGAAAASTYARRYDLQAVLGIVGEDDDDGEAAMGRPKGTAKGAAKPPSLPQGGDALADFPTTIAGKAPAVAQAASGPSLAQLEAMDLKALTTAHAARFGINATKAEVDAAGGATKLKAEEKANTDAVKWLRDNLIGQLTQTGPVK